MVREPGPRDVARKREQKVAPCHDRRPQIQLEENLGGKSFAPHRKLHREGPIQHASKYEISEGRGKVTVGLDLVPGPRDTHWQ